MQGTLKRIHLIFLNGRNFDLDAIYSSYWIFQIYIFIDDLDIHYQSKSLVFEYVLLGVC